MRKKNRVRRKTTITRQKLVQYLDEYLKISSIPDDSQNGLQVEGSRLINKVALAVDACMDTIRAASRLKANFLIVHHGLFWGKNLRITGVLHRRISFLLKNRISLYAAHLPLDCHEDIGNNVELARIIGLKKEGKFAYYHGVEIGVVARPEKQVSRSYLLNHIKKALDAKADSLFFGPAKVKRVGIVAGGAGFFAADARGKGCDTFITGETSHVSYHIAKETALNMIYAGHYASETVGLRALGRHLQEKLFLECKFISAPTGY